MQWILLAFFVLCVTPIVLALVFSWIYRESAISRRLVQEFGLSDDLKKPGLSLQLRHVTNTGSGRSRTFLMDFRGKLPEDVPATLSLQMEGADTGEKARRGEREWETGDVDFDDSFWLGGKPTDYLTADRRTLLLEIFPRLPEARLGDAQITGTLAYSQSPEGWTQLKQTLQAIERLQKELTSPPALSRKQPSGWVGKQKRQAQAGWCLLAGALVLAGSAGYAAMVPLAVNQLDAWCTLSFGLTAILLLHCGLCLRQGSEQALRSFRAAQAGTGLALLFMLPAWWTGLGVMGVTSLLATGAGLAYGMDRAFSAMSRLRLS